MADKVINTFPQGEAAYSKVLGVNAQGETVLIKTEDILLNSGNLVPTTQRLDANEVFGTSTSSAEWSPFQSAVLTVIDDYVNIGNLDTNNQFTGVRADGMLALMENGKTYRISFEYQTDQSVSLVFGTNNRLQYPSSPDWMQVSYEFVMSSDITRLQIGKNAWTYAEGNYIHIRNFCIKEKVGIDVSNFRNNLYYNGKKLSIIGDSISTCSGKNAVQFTVLQSDIDNSVELKGYPTYYDIGKTIGGVEVTSGMVGVETTFTPVEGDLGKTIGEAKNYNTLTEDNLWWKLVADSLKMSVLANVSWSGSSISSHQSSSDEYKTSHSWHPAQIAKLSQRDSNGVLQTPDVIIVFRGGNDFSHGPYARLGAFGADSTEIPVTDYDGSVYLFRDAYAILISKLHETYPKADIFICTMSVIKKVIYDHYPTRNGYYTLPQMSNAIREVANAMGVGLIEFDKDGITFENCYSEGYITDSATTPTHPNAKGHTQMAKKAVADMLAYITSL